MNPRAFLPRLCKCRCVRCSLSWSVPSLLATFDVSTLTRKKMEMHEGSKSPKHSKHDAGTPQAPFPPLPPRSRAHHTRQDLPDTPVTRFSCLEPPSPRPAHPRWKISPWTRRPLSGPPSPTTTAGTRHSVPRSPATQRAKKTKRKRHDYAAGKHRATNKRVPTFISTISWNYTTKN